MERINTPRVAANPTLYSQAIKANGFVFISGQVGQDEQGRVVGETVAAQTEKALQNLVAVLEAAGCRREDLVKVNAYLKDIERWDEFNEVYRRFFPDNPPCRTTLHAPAPKGFLVEIEAIAVEPGR